MKKLIKKILRESEDLNWAQEAVSGELRPTRSLTVKRPTNKLVNAIETHTEVMHGDGDSYDRNTVIYYRDGKGKWKNDDWNAQFNFDDFELVVAFLKGQYNIDYENYDETEFFVDAGVIDHDEYADNGFEEGSIEEVYYYDDAGNKYDGVIDGITTVSTYVDDDEEEDEEDFDDEDDEDDEDNEDDDDMCDECGGYDDNGWGICSDCEDEEEDEEIN